MSNQQYILVQKPQQFCKTQLNPCFPRGYVTAMIVILQAINLESGLFHEIQFTIFRVILYCIVLLNITASVLHTLVIFRIGLHNMHMQQYGMLLYPNFKITLKVKCVFLRMVRYRYSKFIQTIATTTTIPPNYLQISKYNPPPPPLKRYDLKIVVIAATQNSQAPFSPNIYHSITIKTVQTKHAQST
ncbi:hypothetical protein SS50377_28481 [Spironucleus salmonicida]|uniref:Transmembrane protein n=1 Tax=Spironucleus salmonicida TaxID=348837 RepID=A0A9P8LK39_9EUKA|nr:hypothetical protein SS50377_28481 [Spironucleus salmonicida]